MCSFVTDLTLPREDAGGHDCDTVEQRAEKVGDSRRRTST
jgi:hypothetical protein